MSTKEIFYVVVATCRSRFFFVLCWALGCCLWQQQLSWLLRLLVCTIHSGHKLYELMRHGILLELLFQRKTFRVEIISRKTEEWQKIIEIRFAKLINYKSEN